MEEETAKPILFNTDGARAILEGRKAATRRVVKPQPRYSLAQMPLGPHKGEWHEYNESSLKDPTIASPWGYQYTLPYHPGDILYVRETWTHTCIHCKHYPDMFFCPPDCGTCSEFAYKADGIYLDGWPDKRWRPSIHMPREAARIFLRVTDVRVEQLYAITGRQARAEGFLTRDAFIRAFLTIYPDCTVKSWVWVIEFERISREEAEYESQGFD